MAISAKLYAKFPLNLGGGTAAGSSSLDLLSDALNLSLHTGTYVPNQSTNEIKADATNELSTAGGYTANGQALASKTYASSSLVSTFDAADLTWTALTVTFQLAVLCDFTTATLVKPLILYVDTGGTQTVSSLDVSFVWNASGIFTFTVS